VNYGHYTIPRTDPIRMVYCRECDRWISDEFRHKCLLSSWYAAERYNSSPVSPPAQAEA
jgi:hypothetical protein